MNRLREILFSFFLVSLLAPTGAEAVQISVLEPSVWETVMESGRDFYVIGKIDREGKTAAETPFDIRVEVAVTGLVRAGERIPVRTVQSRVDPKTGVTPMRDIMFTYEGKAPWIDIPRAELEKSPPPDLVYRFADIESFYDPSVKAVVTEDSFAVLVQGGVTKDFDTIYAAHYDGDLEWKLFRVFVAAISGDQVLTESEMDIMFGTVQDKVLSRFSPPEHLKNVEAFAKEHGYRIYKNSFPGYWNYGLSRTYEIPLRWRRNNSLEYVTGRVHAMIYNIRGERSATQEVELGHIAYEGWLESDEIIYYHYDVGEPFVPHKTFGGTAVRQGKLIPFNHGDKLAFTRVSYAPKETASFDYKPYDPERVEWPPVVLIDTGEDELFRIYGVVTPIQPHLSEVTANDDGTYTIGNRIAKVRYEFIDGASGEILYAAERPVELSRKYEDSSGKWSADSIYEFRHEFALPKSLYGKIFTVHAKAYDHYYEPVFGTEEVFLLRVR